MFLVIIKALPVLGKPVAPWLLSVNMGYSTLRRTGLLSWATWLSSWLLFEDTTFLAPLKSYFEV